MAFDVVVPQMGESVLEGTILEWKVKVGDPVKADQPLVELMTDKINIEIPSEVAGILTHQFAKEGDVVPVGTRIATIDDGGGKADTAKKKEDRVAASAQEGQAATTAPAAATATATRPARPAVQGTAAIGQGKLSPKVRMLIREYSLDPTTIVPTGKDGVVKVEDVMRERKSVV